MSVLLNYDYPGNVRELKNIIERMVALSEDGVVAAEDLPVSLHVASGRRGVIVDRNLPSGKPEPLLKNSISRKLCRRAGGNVTRCAGNLGITPRQALEQDQRI